MSDWQSIRGDAAALPTDPMNMKFRPTGVTVVGYVVKVAAIWQFIVGAFAITEAITTSQASRFWNGQYLATVSDAYLWFYGIVAIVFGALLWWIARTLVQGDQTARLVVIALAILNIIFALFSFPWGVVGIIVNTLVIIGLSTNAAARWFQEDAGYRAGRDNAFK